MLNVPGNGVNMPFIEDPYILDYKNGVQIGIKAQY